MEMARFPFTVDLFVQSVLCDNKVTFALEEKEQIQENPAGNNREFSDSASLEYCIGDRG